VRDNVSAMQDNPAAVKGLGMRVVIQAFKDMADGDPLKAIDALLWLLDDCPLWLEGLGLDLDPIQLLANGKVRKVRKWQRM
jgi:hypothetical protein